MISALAKAQFPTCTSYTGCSTCTLTSPCNLVCNGGFESIGGDNGGLPTYSCQTSKACGWGLYNSSPDFFYSGGAMDYSVPCNVQGGENNHTTGTGTGGYVGFSSTAGESLQTLLTTSMTAGAVYQIEFYLSLADGWYYNSTNAVGVDLRNSSGYSVSGPLVVNESGVSASGWTKFSITYTANGDEDLLVIGGVSGNIASVASNTNPIAYCTTSVSPVSGSYYFLDDVSVKKKITVTASTTTLSPCTGEPVTLTGSGATTYTWTDGITTYTNNPLTVTPSGPTTYTLSGTDGSGCTDYPDATITIRPASCCANSNTGNIYFRNVNIVPYGTAGATTYTSLTAGNYYIGAVATSSTGVFTQTLTVMGTMSISANMTFSLCNIAIQEDATVSQYSSTTIDRSWLYGCGGLWNGISSYNGITVTNSFIEDAYAGINAGIFMFITHPGVVVDNTVFNKCYYGMTVGTSTMNPGNFKVTGSVFTSRTISAALHDFTPGTRYVTSLAPLTSKVPAKILGSAAQSITANTIRSNVGIYFAGLVSGSPGTNFVVGSVAPSSSTLNPTYTNVFDYVNEGVYNYQSNLEIYNNQFSTMASGAIGTTLGGIYHDAGSGSGTAYTKVGSIGTGTLFPTANYKNVFKTVAYGVTAVNGGTLDVEYNDFNLINFYGVNVKSWYASTPANEPVMVANNSFTDAAYCFYGYDNHAITASVISNTAVLSAGTYSTYYNVYVNEINTPTLTTYYVHDNNFTGSWNGIYATNTYNLRAVKNTITIGKPTGTNKNAGVTLDNSNNCFVGENTIKCNPTNSGSANTAGINSNITPNTVYKCNDIQHVGACFLFKGNCNPVSLYMNSINSNTADPVQYGLLLDNTGQTGDIGYYNGFSWAESDDLWGSFSIADTYVQGISTGATIYYNAAKTPTADYTPIVNTFSTGSTAYTKTNNTNANSQGCNETQRMASQNEGTGRGGSVTQINEPFAGNRKPIIMHLPDPANAKTIYGAPAGNEAQFFAVDSLINSYATSKDTAQLNSARGINSGINPANNIEQHQKSFNAIYCMYMKQDTLVTRGQINDLTTMAQLCPFTEGTAIYQARALLRRWNDTTFFVNDCELFAQAENSERFVAPAKSEEVAKPIKVYPNPTSGLLTVEGCSKICIFELTDMLGRKLLSQPLSENATLIDLHVLNNGTYLYKIVQDGRTIRQDKLVINR